MLDFVRGLPDWAIGGMVVALWAVGWRCGVWWTRRRTPRPSAQRSVPTLPDVAVRIIPPLPPLDTEALLTVPPVQAGRWDDGPRYSIDQVIAEAERELRK